MQVSNEYDQYIIGDQSIEDAPCVKWARFDFSNINGHTFKDISDDIQNKLKTEQSKWKPLLAKGAFYLTTAVAVVCMLAAAVEIGGDWPTALSTVKLNSPFTYFIIFSGLSGLFQMFHNNYSIEARTNVKLAYLNLYFNERTLLQTWYKERRDNFEILQAIVKRHAELKSENDEQNKTKINVVSAKLKGVLSNVLNNMNAINALPNDIGFILLES